MQAHPSINLPQAVPVWPENAAPRARAEDGVFPKMHYYLPSEEHRPGQTVLILPGGGVWTGEQRKGGTPPGAVALRPWHRGHRT